MTAGGLSIRILGVHGIRNRPDGPSEPGEVADRRAVEWKTLLLKALAADARDQPEISVEIAYYAHHLNHNRPVAHGPDAELGRLDPDTAQFIVELADTLGVTGPVAQGRSGVRTAMEFLSRQFGLDGPQMTRFAERYLREFPAYLMPRDIRTRTEVRREVARKINELKPHVVIGHDLGCVVAYEALAADDLVTVTVPLFLTLGCPLGQRWVFERLQPVPIGALGAWPHAVRCWEDLYDQGDPFAVPRPLKKWFSGSSIGDRKLDLGFVHYHDESTYLSCAELGSVLKEHFGPHSADTLRGAEIPGTQFRPDPVGVSVPMGLAPSSATPDGGREGKGGSGPWTASPSVTTPNESGAASDMADIDLSLEDQVAFRNALVYAFNNTERLEGILEDIQFPRERWPAVPAGTANTDRAWRDVFRDLREGILADGFRTLLIVALRSYPSNKTFLALASRYAPDLLDRDKPRSRETLVTDAPPPAVVRPGFAAAQERPEPPAPNVFLDGLDLQDAQILLVGCASYPGDPVGLPFLPSVSRNLTALADVFGDPAVFGIPEERLVVVRDPDLARTMMKPLADLARQEARLLIVYYAGHGIVADGELRLGLTTTTTDTPASGLEGRLLRREVANSLSGTKVLIVDACFSGRLTGLQAGTGSLVEGELDVQGTVTLASSAGDAASLAPPGQSLTAFTGELVDVIRTGISGRGQLLSVADVFGAVRAGMRRKGRPEPRILNTDLAVMSPLCKNVSYRA
jgi:hypothetical protein